MFHQAHLRHVDVVCAAVLVDVVGAAVLVDVVVAVDDDVVVGPADPQVAHMRQLD